MWCKEQGLPITKTHFTFINANFSQIQISLLVAIFWGHKKRCYKNTWKLLWCGDTCWKRSQHISNQSWAFYMFLMYSQNISQVHIHLIKAHFFYKVTGKKFNNDTILHSQWKQIRLLVTYNLCYNKVFPYFNMKMANYTHKSGALFRPFACS